ncbi:MAG: glycosyltransferase family 4 protein [Candidatus Omnitrophica bacterium]|nr:glycosyltransferase family 4 protein [Candidatus Omnitrophota bacterium]
MRVLLLTTHMNIGGIGIYLSNLAKGLKKKKVDVFVASSGGGLVKEVVQNSIPHLFLNIRTKSELSPKVPLAIGLLNRFIKREGIDIIHAQTRVTQVVGYWSAILRTIPYISTCHGFFRPHLTRRKFGCWGNKVIAISEAVKGHLIDDMGVANNRIALIHNGIEVERFARPISDENKKYLKERFGLGRGPIIGSLGRLSPVKGFDLLVKAMKDIIKVMPDAQLLLVGDGPEGEKLRSLSKELGVEESIVFVPSVENGAELLSIMDVAVFPSIQEGLGLSLIEAMAVGRPVIASDVGGISTLVKDSETGLLFPKGDVASMAGKIIRLLTEDGLRDRIRKNGQEKVRRDFTSDQMCEKVINVYKESLGGSR